jgi:hypothetical protein
MIYFTMHNFSQKVVLLQPMHKRYNNLLHLTKQALFTKFEMKPGMRERFGEDVGRKGVR